MSHRRRQKKGPAVPSNPQPKNVDNQTAQKIDGGTVLTTGNPKTSEHHDDSETKTKDAWYWRWCRNLFNFLESSRVIALGTIFLAVVGIGSLVETKWSLDESRQSFEMSQRPYVSLGRKDGIVAEVVEPKGPVPPDALIGLNLYMKNGGRGPALTPHVGIMMGVTLRSGGSPPSEHAVQPRGEALPYLLRWKSTKDNTIYSNVDTSPILADSEFVHYVPDQFTQEQATALLNGQRYTLLTGRYEYCDEFGNYYCRQFTLDYESAPFDRFVESPWFDCTSWYAYPPRQPDQIYLPPCEQPDEREARERAERKREIQIAAEAPLASPSPSPTATPTPK